jgi:hypothetical protein
MAQKERRRVRTASAGAEWIAFALLASLSGCGGARHPGSSIAPLSGQVVDAQSGSTLQHASVEVCQQISDDPLAVGEVWPRCLRSAGEAHTDERGRFSLQLGERADAKPLWLIAREMNHATGVLTGTESELRAQLRSPIRIDGVIEVRGHIRTSDGTPIARAGFGFAALGTHGLISQYTACCSGNDGAFRLRVHNVTAPTVWVFALVEGESRTIAAQEVSSKPGANLQLELVAKDRLVTVRGHALTDDGLPLTGLIAGSVVEPPPTALDLALLSLQGGETDPSGHFAIDLRGPSTIRLSLLARNADHSRRELISKEVRTTDSSLEVELRAAQVRAVTCSLVQGDVSVPLDELELMFGNAPPGATELPLYAGGPASSSSFPERSRPSEIRFSWPEGATLVTVVARGSLPPLSPDAAPRAVQGGYLLRSPSESCRIPVTDAQP